jgi:hypothetical protein
MTQMTVRQRVRLILLNDWDPIDIRDVPQAQDEYDSYIASIEKMVIARSPTAELSNYLLQIETKTMGLRGDPARARSVAVKLRSIVL